MNMVLLLVLIATTESSSCSLAISDGLAQGLDLRNILSLVSSLSLVFGLKTRLVLLG